MAPGQRRGAVRRSPPSLAFSPPLPARQAAGCQGARRAGVALSLPLALLPGFNLSATPLPAPRKVQPLDRSVLAAGFGEEGGRRLEEQGGGKRGGECSGRSGKLRAAFPPQSVELECGGARRRRRLLRHQTPGLGGAWGHLLLSQEEPSPDRFQPDFSLPISFFFLSLSFFSPIHFSCLRTSDCCSPSLPGAQLWGCSSLRLRAGTRAQRRGEEKKKNLSEGFRHPTVTPFPQTQTFHGGHPRTGESSFRADSPLGFGQAPALAEELDLF